MGETIKPGEALPSPSAGPWSVDGEGIRAMVRAADGRIIALRHRATGPQNEADMRFIASAPDMLAALRGMVALFDDGACVADLHEIRGPLAAARSAIARATESPNAP